ncbi:CpaE family protein [Methylocapsa sp. S129]|uniref:AAA family ATPase n=1 Tax=Methylocapsa sp. S129 TaxID=1641869 RepID=UPI0015766446|nr:CpaE family protein [Methylocapsa sp. S129]
MPNVQQISPVPRISIQAFCETQEVATIVQAAISDRRMNKAHVKLHMGGAPAAVEAYRSAPTPNLIVLEATHDRNALVGYLDDLSQFCDAGTKVIICGKVNDIVLYRQLMLRGVSEYLVAPFGVMEFVQAVSNLYTAPGASPVGRVVAVIGAKGGVGSSTIAHNVAWSIASGLDTSTIIADLDLGFGTAGLDYNQDPPQGIAEAVFAPDRVDANLVDRLLSKCSDNLSLLAAPATLDRLYDFPETAFDSIIDVVRASTPCIILDLPHAWTAWTRRMLVGADEVIIVAAPDLANLRNAKNMLDSIRSARPNDHQPKLILNGVGLLKRPEIAVADFTKTVELEPLAVIPHDAKLFGAAANNGQMIAEIDANCKIAEIFNDLARAITGKNDIRKAKRGLFEPLLAKLGRKRA